jgi:hypothetical protein
LRDLLIKSFRESLKQHPLRIDFYTPAPHCDDIALSYDPWLQELTEIAVELLKLVIKDNKDGKGRCEVATIFSTLNSLFIGNIYPKIYQDSPYKDYHNQPAALYRLLFDSRFIDKSGAVRVYELDSATSEQMLKHINFLGSLLNPENSKKAADIGYSLKSIRADIGYSLKSIREALSLYRILFEQVKTNETVLSALNIAIKSFNAGVEWNPFKPNSLPELDSKPSTRDTPQLQQPINLASLLQEGFFSKDHDPGPLIEAKRKKEEVEEEEEALDALENGVALKVFKGNQTF